MSRVTTIDASGSLVLKDAIEKLERRGITVLVSGIRDGHHRPLEALGVIGRLDATGRVFASTPEAIAAARELLHGSGVLPAPRNPGRRARPSPYRRLHGSPRTGPNRRRTRRALCPCEPVNACTPEYLSQ